MQNVNKSLNESLQAKYPHLEIAILSLSQVQKDNESKRIDSEYFKKEYLENEARLLNLNPIQLKDTDISIKHPAEIQRNYVDSENGVWFFRTQNLRPLFIDSESNQVFISKQDAKRLAKNLIQKDDILITRTGANCGDCAVYNIDIETIASSHILIAKNSFFNQCFLAVFLNTQYGKKQINMGIYGGLQPEIAPYYLKNIYVPQFSQDFQLEIQNLVQDSHKALEDSKVLYKEAENLLYEALGLDSHNPLESLQTYCHTESVARSISNNPQNRDISPFSQAQYDNLDSSFSTKAQNDNVMDCHENSNEFSRNDTLSCHTRSPLCHADRSEVSKNTNTISQNHLDSSLRASHFAQNDNVNSPSLARGDSQFSPSLAEGARGWVEKYPHLNLSIRPLSQSYGISGRLDSEYYQTKYDLMESKIKDYQGGYFQLQPSEIKDSNFTPKAREQYRYIELANIGNNGNISEPLEDLGENLPTRARRKVKTGDFIMSSIEGSLASCAIITPEFDNCLVSTGFYVLDSANLNSETLLVLFKCAFFQEYLRKFPSGTILTAISKDELQNILIPKIDSATQEQIASKIQKSFALRKKSKDLLQSAKAKVEQNIENSAK
ncbi:hypothetical protein [Helicobacter sp. 23-1046]